MTQLLSLHTLTIFDARKIFVYNGNTVAAVTFTAKANNLFSVSADRQVQFAPGNLQYNQQTGKYSFASEQYEYIGANWAENTTVDLFGWGDAPESGSIETAANNGIYTWPDGTDPWGNAAKDLDGGNWRTPTIEDFMYIIGYDKNRDGVIDETEGRSVDGISLELRWARARITIANGTTVDGILVFPDLFEWDYATMGEKHPTQDVVASAWSDEWSKPGTAYEGKLQKYTYAQWEAMEDAGCVFLPAAGYRLGTTMIGAGVDGDYRSSSPDGDSNAFILNFSGRSLNSAGTSARYYGFPVRLVKNYE